jgi:hypothetical protein
MKVGTIGAGMVSGARANAFVFARRGEPADGGARHPRDQVVAVPVEDCRTRNVIALPTAAQ